MLLTVAALLNLLGELTATTDEIVCDGLVFDKMYFDKEILVTNVGRPYNLVVHKYTGTLFFSHTIQKGSNVDFMIVSCDIDKKYCNKIDGVQGGYAIGYDTENNDMYFGGHNGIYKYRFMSRTADFFAEEGKSIWSLFIRNGFYYIEYPTQKLFVYHDDRFEPVAKAINIEIDNFFVSKTGDVYFSNETALCKVEKDNIFVLGDRIVFRQIVDDKYGDVYFCADDGVYIEERPYHKIKKIAHIEKAFGLAFDDKGNVIYSDADSIYRLLPSNISNVCYEKIASNSQWRFTSNFFY